MTVERIRRRDGGKSKLGMISLIWNSHIERRRQADELCRALEVQLGSGASGSRDPPSMSTLAAAVKRFLLEIKKHQLCH